MFRIDLPLELFTSLKLKRNSLLQTGKEDAYYLPYSEANPEKEGSMITVMGKSLGLK